MVLSEVRSSNPLLCPTELLQDFSSDSCSTVARFFLNRPIRELAHAALQRLVSLDHGSTRCLLFPTVTFAWDCARYIAKEHPDATMDVVQFRSSTEHNERVAQVLSLAGFAMTIFPQEAKQSAMMFWTIAGGGLTTRHAMFAMDHLRYLEVTPSNKAVRIEPPEPVASLKTPSWILDFDATAMHVRSTIAELATPEDSSLTPITAEHVTLYCTGMSAIYHASQSMQAVAATSTVVAFGLVCPLCLISSRIHGFLTQLAVGCTMRRSTTSSTAHGKNSLAINEGRSRICRILHGVLKPASASGLYSAKCPVMSFFQSCHCNACELSRTNMGS